MNRDVTMRSLKVWMEPRYGAKKLNGRTFFSKAYR